MKNIFTLLFLLACLTLCGQTMGGFENYELNETEFLNNTELGYFESGNVILPNEYEPTYDFWTGWAISKATDTSTPGFNNQYSSIVGSGNEGSTTYAMGYASQPITINLKEDAIGKVIDGMHVTNSTYAFLSMQLGDSFAKKFGGATGEDPDFYLLTIKKWYDGEMGADSVDFYLADFRFDTPAFDYLIDQWTYVDLSVLGNVDSLQLSLTSSDVGQFGMNTPAYFCVDDIVTSNVSGSNDLAQSLVEAQVYPNPAAHYIELDLDYEGSYDFTVYNELGRKVLSTHVQQGITKIDVSELPSGMYQVIIKNKDGNRSISFYKL